MAEDNMTLGYLMGQESNGGSGGFGNFGEGIWAVIILAILFGRGGLGGFGGFGGGGSDCGCASQADMRAAVDQQTLISKLDQQTYGLADSTYALNNAITNGFHGVDNAVCNLGFNLQTAINGISREIGDCCCTTQRAIDGVNYNMATQFCALGNTIQSSTRDIIDSQNAGTRAILDFLVQEKLSAKDARIAELSNQLSQSQQNGVIRAAIDASTAEIIRRTGNECPVPSYLVQPPTPVNFPINGCGTVQFGNYGNYGNNCGCGCN